MPAEGGKVRAISYERVSTYQQEDGTSLDGQRALAAAYAQQRGWDLVDQLYDVITGKESSRPGLDELRYRATQGEFDVLIVYKVDRLGRSLKEVLRLHDEMQELDVAIAGTGDNIDTTTPQGKMVFQLMATFAEYEWDLIRERTNGGKIRRVREGGWGGGPPPYGFKLSPGPGGRGSVLEVDDDEATSIQLMYRLLVKQGWTTGQVALHLNALGSKPRNSDEWSSTQVRQLLTGAKAVTGTWRFRSRGTDEVIEHDVDPILSEAEFAELQAWLRFTSTNPKQRRFYTLSRRITSPCGTSMTGRAGPASPDGSRTRIYRCSKNGNDGCTCHGLRADRVEAIVWDAVKGWLKEPERLVALATADSLRTRDVDRVRGNSVASLERQVSILTERIGRDVRGLIDAGLSHDEAAASVASLRTEREELEKMLASHHAQRDRALVAGRVGSRLADKAAEMADLFDEATPEDIGAFFAITELRVTVTGWVACPQCGGAGMVGNRRPSPSARSSEVCSTCERHRFLPRLTIEGKLHHLLASLEESDAEIIELHQDLPPVVFEITG